MLTIVALISTYCITDGFNCKCYVLRGQGFLVYPNYRKSLPHSKCKASSG